MTAGLEEALERAGPDEGAEQQPRQHLHRCPPEDPDPGGVWRRVDERLRLTVGDSQHGVWIARLHVHAIIDGRLVVLGAPAPYRGHIESRFGRALAACASGELGPQAVVEVVACAGRQVEAVG